MSAPNANTDKALPALLREGAEALDDLAQDYSDAATARHLLFEAARTIKAQSEALEQSLPWLVLLGDYIGNGTAGNPDGRCVAIGALHEAYTAATGKQLVNKLPAALAGGTDK